MKTAIELADEFPEQNLANIEPDAVNILNGWGIEAVAMLLQQAEQIDALKALVDNPRNTPFGKEAEKLADDWLDANAHGGWIDALRNKNEALEITNAALKADAERLDLLESTFFAKRWNGVIDSGSQTTWHIVPGYQHSTCLMVGHTFRAAIDAMKGKS